MKAGSAFGSGVDGPVVTNYSDTCHSKMGISIIQEDLESWKSGRMRLRGRLLLKMQVSLSVAW